MGTRDFETAYAGDHDMVVVVDFGAQTSQLIARRVRECRVYCELWPHTVPVEEFRRRGVKGIILAGGPALARDSSVAKHPEPAQSALVDQDPAQGRAGAEVNLEAYLDLGIPVLAVGSGMQAMVRSLGGEVRLSAEGASQAYGKERLELLAADDLFQGLEELGGGAGLEGDPRKLGEGDSGSAGVGSQDVSGKGISRKGVSRKDVSRKDVSRKDVGNGDVVSEGVGSEVRGLEAWLSVGDAIVSLPRGFEVIARTPSIKVAAVRWKERRLYGAGFHPEVSQTPRGKEMIRNFVLGICGCEPTWTMGNYIEDAVAEIRRKVGDGRVVCALSGGVDSSVAAALVYRAVGEQLTSIFVDHGFLRLGEAEQVIETFRGRFGDGFVHVDARERFLEKLAGVIDPEAKRKRIGEEFIRVFEEEAAKLGDIRYLVQGTVYPDVIESGFGSAATIKSHHNVGGLPEKMDFELLEPLRLLFKDEVRALGEELGLPERIVWRQPFPGPGLAIRVIGEVTRERLKIERRADAIVVEEIERAGLAREVFQYFAVLSDTRTVGVTADERTYGYVAAVRAVTSVDGMTAGWARLPYDVLERIAERIMREVPQINRVVYDISSKPPATIEWE